MLSRIEIIEARHLDADHCAAWNAIRSSSHEFDSPYFHPEFTKAVGAVRSDVFVAVIERYGQPVAFFPFQRSLFGQGRPVGGRLNDSHGIVASADFNCDWRVLLRACGLKKVEFSHLVGRQSTFDRGVVSEMRVRSLDLKDGYDAYRARIQDRGCRTVKQSAQKLRKMVRELGPVHFTLCGSPDGILSQLMSWKSEQYTRTGYTDIFSFGWTKELARRLVQSEGDLRGCVSGLFAGDRLVAAHFGIVCGGVLHYWFPSYNTRYRRYSPGCLLLLETAKRCEELGIHRIDLGKDDTRFKHEFGDRVGYVREGVLRSTAASVAFHRAGKAIGHFIKSSSIGRPARNTAALLRPIKDRMSFR
ncbi:GNAT family N-acetyltransferase [Stratiformator vulcanicus]|uniref:BioF2-like acetyltransferase domain-containing protein n=1 Tax=Stratiformator vulcanicus TaxID=2527980 RepID=A0A517R475_9PLAN|nr:GNAT family N-acetyltransferase [Stratiformator vulcanicus]QDT38633.1 hypothetical protein Pan189_30280 [Stratiformator vulcanicus]